MRKIVFGIRGSRLARAQLDEFTAYLSGCGITIEFDIRTVKTRGDRRAQTPVEELGQGVFVKELEQEIVSGKIDCAIHSLKDMPVRIAEGTVLACYPPRADARDCLVCSEGVSSKGLKGLRVAAGSPRREAFLKEREPGIETLPVRGNIDTRLKKLDAGEFGAMVLAACGLKRAGYGGRISELLDPDTFVPAAGQGAVVAQTRRDDRELNLLLRDASCAQTGRAAGSERMVLEELGIGCRTPFGVFARFEDASFVMTAKLYTGAGKEPYEYCRLEGPAEEYGRVTERIVQEMKARIK